MTRSIRAAAVVAAAFTLGACADLSTGPDAALLGPDTTLERPGAAAGAQRAPAPGAESIAAIAIEAGFSELVGALSYVDAELDAGLVDLFLNGTDQFTVFAPTDEAFEALYGVLGVGGITEVDAELVLDVLLYHVVEGRRAANSVVPPVRARTITTLLGATFSVDRNGVITDIAGQNATIVAPNISASNGIIHVIDTVILPLD
ncbi:MAG: fasciclin domain-containing protein [Gemmatimonadales bacterium]|nr:MAG: fasciclin domain-containing protein [Gemmatimonadales bacterium]